MIRAETQSTDLLELRQDVVQNFLSGTPWKDARKEPLKGDASRRRYTRLFQEKEKKGAMLMDAPPFFGEDVRPFISVGTYLNSLSLSAPEIYHADRENGLLILEDFGDSVFDVVCDQNPNSEVDLYDAAVDVLITLARAPAMEALSDYQSDMARVAASVIHWYADPSSGTTNDNTQIELEKILQSLISDLTAPCCTVLRDFHAQNLIWLGQKSGQKRVGLLDFQDAMAGPIVYDLVSLVTDARRDVTAELRERCLDRFQKALKINKADFERDVAICAAQRNLRILMVFARMSLHFEKPHYVDLIPRVWDHLERALEHPDLTQLKEFVQTHIPAPTPKILTGLKDKCGTYPMV